MASKYSRVFSNTISLYIRMIILTVISLFTVRIVLNVLGESDYGTYNLVGGVVSMFSFVTGTLVVAAQRYFAYHLSNQNWDSVNKYFSINLVINSALIILILLLAETIGTWFVRTQLVIEEGRKEAALWVYHLSVVTFLSGFLISPFQALLVADENLGIYSIMSIAEGLLKVLVVYLLNAIQGDKLIIYAVLLLSTSLLVMSSYVVYCVTKYKQLRFRLVKDIGAYKELFAFTNWSLIGAIAHVCKGQGINIVINLFFGTVMNAARGIAYQISNVVSSFSQNFMKAIDPQIIKAHAAGERENFFGLIYTASKLAYFLLFVIVLPLICNMEYVLTLWLENVPERTILFTCLVLVDALALSFTDSIGTGVQAVGKIKYYQIIVGGLALLNIPLSYGLLLAFENPLIPFIVGISVSTCMSVARVIVFRKICAFPAWQFCVKAVFPIVAVTGISSVLYVLLTKNAESFLHLVLNVIISLCINIPLIIMVGMSKAERGLLLSVLPFVKKRDK